MDASCTWSGFGECAASVPHGICSSIVVTISSTCSVVHSSAKAKHFISVNLKVADTHYSLQCGVVLQLLASSWIFQDSVKLRFIFS